MFIRLLEKSTGATKDNRRIIETVTHLQNLYATCTSKDQQETLTQALESSTLALPSEKVGIQRTMSVYYTQNITIKFEYTPLTRYGRKSGET